MKPFFFTWLVGVLMVTQTNGAESLPTPTPLALGSQAPDFNLPGVDGRNWALSDFSKAKVLVIVFTCNHCPTAQYYEERIKKLAADYQERGVALVAVSPNAPEAVRLDELGWSDLGDSFEEMKLRARDRQYNFPYLYDGENEKVSRAYGPVATPHVFVFDQGRQLRYAGAIDDSERVQHVKIHYLRDAIESLLTGKQPVVTQTKVVGCSVKWSDKSGGVTSFMAKLAAEPVRLDKADAEALKALRKNSSGKFRLVTFWATWCAPCVAEFDEFVTINRMYRHRDFELVTVSINRPDEMADVQAFLKKRQSSCRNLIFATNDRELLMNSFDPEWPGGVPFTVLIDPDGKIVHRELGSIDALALRRAIVKFMNERKPW
jgi:thiol-disulfide isomerase/thioredoxin